VWIDGKLTNAAIRHRQGKQTTNPALYQAASSFQDLGIIGDDPYGFSQSVANGVSDNNTVVGWVGDIFYGSPQGFVWTPDGGMVFAKDYLAAQGVTVPDEWYILGVTAISADGKTIGGQAIRGW
jgi:hypothetical protein